MSLKIIHTADWHLGQTFFGYDREEEHDAFLSWLIRTLTDQQADVLLIAGDVFDVANPSATAQRRFFHFLKEAHSKNPALQIIIIAGNHDSAARLEAPVPLLEELNTSIVGIINRKEDRSIDFDSLLLPLYNKEGVRKAWCMAVPYLRQGDYPPSDDMESTYVDGINRMYKQLCEYALSKRKNGESIIAMGHLHATGAELSDNDRSERIIMGGLESVSSDTFLPAIAYTALGHIHRAQQIGGRKNVRYAGSPLPMSFSETNYSHLVVAVTIENDNVQVDSIPIPVTVKLIRVPVRPTIADDVLKELEGLPDIVEGDNSPKPFLEVRVLMTEPDPGFRHKVEKILKTKAVRLNSIVPSYLQNETEEQMKSFSYTDLQKIDPLDMLRHAFTVRYGSELPQEIEELFNDVMREVSS